jgi:hypothetical protein
MVTIPAGVATFERHLIKARTDEGRKRPQAQVKFAGIRLQEFIIQNDECSCPLLPRTSSGKIRRGFIDLQGLMA